MKESNPKLQYGYNITTDPSFRDKSGRKQTNIPPKFIHPQIEPLYLSPIKCKLNQSFAYLCFTQSAPLIAYRHLPL